MNAIKFVLRLVGWLVTILLQVAGSFLFIFIFSVIFAGTDTKSRLGWLSLLLVIWLGYIIGINLVGQLALRLVWLDAKQLGWQRLVGTAIGGLIPMLMLLVVGYQVPVGAEGTTFYELITSNWQPILAQASLFTSIVGYYLPGMLVTRQPAAVPG